MRAEYVSLNGAEYARVLNVSDAVYSRRIQDTVKQLKRFVKRIPECRHTDQVCETRTLR